MLPVSKPVKSAMLLFSRQGSILLCLLSLLAPALAWADPLEEAQALVLSVSLLVAVGTEEVHAMERAEPWEFRPQLVRANGQSTEVPTAERERAKEIAQARVRLETARQQVTREFLTEVQGLCERQSRHLLAKEMIPFFKDQLSSHEQMKREGLIEKTALWEFAKQAQDSKITARQTGVEYEAALDRVARQYGGTQWQKLKVLLDAHTKQIKP